MEDVVLHNITRNMFTFLWFAMKRTDCRCSKHLWPSLLLLHEAVYPEASPCHNINIFEACWQVDVATFAISTIVPRRLLGLVASSLWFFLLRADWVRQVSQP